MASGGSTPPTQLTIPQLSSNFLATSADTLQTPKLSLTPVTSINLASSGEGGGKAFTSLEELLNITGINSSDYKGASNSDNGVDSLSKIAQAVENSQQESHDQRPPAKKPRLDAPPPSNIHVQPLTSPTKPLQLNATIASLLHKKQYTGRNQVGPATIAVTTSTLGVNSSSPLTWTEQASAVSRSSMVPPQPVSAHSPGSQPVSAQFPGSQPVSAHSPGSQPVSAQFPGSQPVSAHSPGSQPVSAQFPGSHPVSAQFPGSQPSISTVIPSLMQTPALTSTANPKSFLLQLVQLFKHYQTIGDPEGMNRIKKQLSVIVSASQGRNQGNPFLTALSLLANSTTSAPSSSGSNITTNTQASPNVIGLSGSTPQTVVNLSSTQTSLSSPLLQGSMVSNSSSQSVPPSLLSNLQMRTSPSVKLSSAAANSSVSMNKPITSASLPPHTTVPSGQSAQNSSLAEQLSIQQKAVKQLQTIMASLPAANRPKTAQEIRDFVQKYSSLITQIQSANLPASSIQSTKMTSTPPKLPSSTQPMKSTLSSGPVVVPLNFGPMPSVASLTFPVSSSLASAPSTAMAQVDQHFQNSLSAAKIKSTLNSGPSSSVKPHPPTPPTVVDLTQDTQKSQSSTVSAPITTQFKGGTSNTTVTRPQQPAASSSSAIQAGVATPLPPGLTLETLAVLCRLPESELGKLKLPVGLLSAIKVWKEKQPAKKGNVAQSKANSAGSNIPVLFPPPTSVQPTPLSRSPLTQLKTSVTPLKVGDALSLTGTQPREFKKPFVIPSSAGFPPRSLHAFVPGVGQSHSLLGTSSKQQSSGSSSQVTGSSLNRSSHMTRYRTKADQERAEKEKLQALTKALQSSEEARIAFRFNTHLDKMHSQLLAPDTTTPFTSRQDMLARLLPYHVYAECEPPPAAVEKADAVFESVAQVLLSRSRGLRSRFQQLLAKSDSEGGEELSVMEIELGRRFIEGEEERIQQEKLEKKQAEQVAADLSMMVKGDGSDTFDSEFSLNDAFFPFLDNGIT